MTGPDRTNVAFKLALAIVVATGFGGNAFALQAAGPVVRNQPTAVTSIDMDPLRDRVLSTGLDGVVRVWRLSDAEGLTAHRLHRGDVGSARFVSGGRILSVGVDGRAVLSREDTGRIETAWDFGGWCLALALLPRDQAAVGCADMKIRILDLNAGGEAPVREWVSPGDVRYRTLTSLSASSDGRLLATAGPTALFDVETGALLRASNSFVQNMVFSPAGDRLLGGHIKAGAELWSVEPLRLLAALPTEVEQQVSTLTGTQTVVFNMPVYAVAWSPAGDRFATGGLDKMIRIWALEEDVPVVVATLEGHTSAVSALSWSGNRLVSGDLAGVVRFWSVPDR